MISHSNKYRQFTRTLALALITSATMAGSVLISSHQASAAAVTVVGKSVNCPAHEHHPQKTCCGCCGQKPTCPAYGSPETDISAEPPTYPRHKEDPGWWAFMPPRVFGPAPGGYDEQEPTTTASDEERESEILGDEEEPVIVTLGDERETETVTTSDERESETAATSDERESPGDEKEPVIVTLGPDIAADPPAGCACAH